MFRVFKPLSVGVLAAALLACVTYFGLRALDPSDEVVGAVLMIGAGISGIIGGQVSHHLPPRRQH
jgi:hypothetical protein